MTKEEFVQAQDGLDVAWQKYFDDSHEFIFGRADNTGDPTKDEFLASQE